MNMLPLIRMYACMYVFVWSFLLYYMEFVVEIQDYLYEKTYHSLS